MPIFRKNKKPQAVHNLTWRRPLSGVPTTDQMGYEALMGAFIEDAITPEDAWAARDRREEVFHV